MCLYCFLQFRRRYDVLRAARCWDRPSDHVPVIARFDLD